MNTTNPHAEPDAIPPPHPQPALTRPAEVERSPKSEEGGSHDAVLNASVPEPDEIVNRPVPHRGNKSSIVNRARTGKVAAFPRNSASASTKCSTTASPISKSSRIL